MTFDDPAARSGPDDEALAAMIRDPGPEPPPRLHLPDAIRVARARTARRRLLIGVTSVAAVATLAVAAVPTFFGALTNGGTGPSQAAAPALTSTAVSTPASCQISMLDLPARTRITGGDRTGRYLLAMTPDRKPFLVVDGDSRQIEIPGEVINLADVNSTGVVVATSVLRGDEADEVASWVYRDGKVTKLSGYGEVTANAINERGDIAGSVGGTGDGRPPKPVVWRAGSTTPTELPLPQWATFGFAHGIADDGTIVGTVERVDAPEDRRSVGYVWRPDGSTQELAGPDEATAEHVDARGINGRWVAGRTALPRTHGTAVRWDLTTGEARLFPQLQVDFFDNVNERGWLVGSDGKRHALLVAGDTVVTLPGFGDHATQEPDQAVKVSDDGRIVAGQATDQRGSRHAVVWHCG